MKKNQISIIDEDEVERIKSFNTDINENIDIFKYNKVKEIINNDLIIIPNFDEYRILASLPLYSNIIVECCPYCLTSDNNWIPFVETGHVIPALITDYSKYSPKVIKELLKYPHISGLEYINYRNFQLISREGGALCRHCLEEKISNYNKLIPKGPLSNKITKLVGNIVDNLSPCIEPDFQYLEHIGEALREKNYRSLNQIHELSKAISMIRTVEAFNSPLFLTDELSSNYKQIKLPKEAFNQIYYDPKHLILEELELEMPEGGNISKYLDIIMNHRDSINKIMKQLVAKASIGDNKISLSDLFNGISVINEEIRRAQTSTRYKFISILTNILGSNKGLIAAILGATALGIQGNILGCGASITGGAIVKALSDRKLIQEIINKIKLKGPIDEFKTLISDALEPTVQKIISFYLGTDLTTIQTWRIRNKIKCG